MKRHKIYLYAGYYEMFISDKPMPKPYSLISWHYSAENAIARAEREHPEDPWHIVEHLLPEEYRLMMGDDAYMDLKREEIGGRMFLIF